MGEVGEGGVSGDGGAGCRCVRVRALAASARQLGNQYIDIGVL